MKYKLKSLAIALLLFSNLAQAQQVVDNICMQVIGGNGLSAEKLGRHYDATLGEVMIATLSSSDGTLTITQGFHQPECATVGVNDLNFAVEWQLELFPNPTANSLNLRYQHPSGGQLDARLWSITGVLIRDWQTLPSNANLDCTQLASGIYLLEMRDPETGQQTVARFVKTLN